MNKWISNSILMLVLLVTASAAMAKDDFPGRKLFPDVKPMSLTELNQQFKNVIVVDARTRYEYDTIHITGSHNALVSKGSFEGKIKALRKNSNKPIVFIAMAIPASNLTKQRDAPRMLASVMYTRLMPVFSTGHAPIRKKRFCSAKVQFVLAI